MAPSETAHAWLDAANRADADALVALSDPDIEIVGPRGSVRGAAVLRDWLARAGLTLTPRRTVARGEAVVVEQHATWRDPATGTETQAEVASRFVVREGRVTAYQRHDTLSDALAAAGLDADADAL